MLKTEFLVSTMFCEDTLNLHKNMKIKSNAIIINQTNNFAYKEDTVSNYKVKTLNLNERGVGLSRNTALMRATEDVCVLSDDDMIYDDNAVEIIKKAYDKYPDADMILFDVLVLEKGTQRRTVKKTGRVRLFSCLRYGAVSCTFKRESALKKNMSFSLLFGGGAKYGSGEDSIFLWTAIRKGLRVYSVEERIAIVNNDGSTWFQGYNEKFFFDKGALFYSLSKKFYRFLCIQFIVRHRKQFMIENKLRHVYRIMMEGVKDIKI